MIRKSSTYANGVITRFSSAYTAGATPPPILTTPNLLLWLTSTTGVLDSNGLQVSNGNSIVTWLDQSGNGNHVSGGVSPTLITNVVNSIYPVVRFNGTNQYLTSSNTNFNLSNSVGTFWLVERNLNGSTGAAPYSFGSSSTLNSGIIYQSNSGMQPAWSPKPAYNSSTARIWNYRHSNTNTGDDVRMNGSDCSIDPASAIGTLVAPFDVGRRNVSTIYTSGDILDIIIYTRVLTLTEIQTIESYLNSKYRLF